MKIVINVCFGGFSLSNKAIKRYLELKGEECYFYKQTKWNYSDGYEEYTLTNENDNASSLIYWYTKNLGDKITESDDKYDIQMKNMIDTTKLAYEYLKEYILKNEVDYVKDEYDYIIIDCPPSLNMLTINAMTTADSVLVPIQCEFYALEGLSQLIHTINLVSERLNPNLYIEGVVFTMYDARTNLSLQVVDNVKANLNQNIYKSIIPRNIKLAEAPSHGMPINYYDPKSTGAMAYRELALEVIKNNEEVE